MRLLIRLFSALRWPWYPGGSHKGDMIPLENLGLRTETG